MGSLSPKAIFVADCTGLDFLNSVDEAVDWMGSGEMLISWMDQAQLAPPVALERLRRDADPRCLDRVARRARRLRGWLRGFVHQYRGRPLSGVDVSSLDLLNRILVDDEKYSQVVARDRNGSVLTLQSMRRWAAPESLLRPIGEAVAKLICNEDFTRVKVCEGCARVFLDRTGKQTRKWCSMSTCGNRAKQAAHRSRRRLPRE